MFFIPYSSPPHSKKRKFVRVSKFLSKYQACPIFPQNFSQKPIYIIFFYIDFLKVVKKWESGTKWAKFFEKVDKTTIFGHFRPKTCPTFCLKIPLFALKKWDKSGKSGTESGITL